MSKQNVHVVNQNIYITFNEEIKEGDWYFDSANKVRKAIMGDGLYWAVRNGYKKIILTTDQDLIKDGVQAIDDEFLEWFVKNPSCENVEVVFNNRGISGAEKILKIFGEYKIIIPKEEPKQETLTSVAEKFSELQEGTYTPQHKVTYQHGFIDGAKWQAERMYSEEEVSEIIAEAWNSCEDNEGETYTEARKRIIEQFKKK